MTDATEIEPKRTFRALHNNVLVERDKPKEKVGEIFIPTTSQETQDRGTVLSAREGLDVKAGDRVVFIRSAGRELAIGLLLHETDIYGVLENGTIRPIGAKVILKPDDPKEKEGRIAIPKAYQKEHQQREQLVPARIVAMGKGMRTKSGGRWPMPDVKVGQRVLYFHNYSPEIQIGDEKFVVVSDEQLRAVFEDE